MTTILRYGFIAGVMTTFGAIIAVSCGTLPPKLISNVLGLAGGIMLAIVAFDLIPPSLRLGGSASCILGYTLGIVFMLFLDRVTNRLILHRQQPASMLKTGLLIATGIALHNFPEGIAIGAGLTAEPELGLLLAVAIGLHNIPEGIGFAVPLRLGGAGSLSILLISLLIGFMTPLGAAVGGMVSAITPGAVAVGLAFAAGAMLYIVNAEIIPQAHSYSPSRSVVGFAIGFALVILLN